MLDSFTRDNEVTNNGVMKKIRKDVKDACIKVIAVIK